MPTINDFGIPNVGTTILQPKRKDKFRVLFQGIAGLPSSQILSLQAVTITKPNISFEEIELHRYNSRAWIAGKQNWEPCQFTLEDDVASGASRILQQQLTRQQKLIGVDGPWLAVAAEASSYKFATQIDTMDGNEAVLESWFLEGCFLQAINYGEYDYTANEALKIDVTIRFDHARQEIYNYAGSGKALGGGSAS